MIENMILRILSAFLVASSVGSAQPNIIILYSDDAGYADFGFQPNCAADMKKFGYDNFGMDYFGGDLLTGSGW